MIEKRPCTDIRNVRGLFVDSRFVLLRFKVGGNRF